MKKLLLKLLGYDILLIEAIDKKKLQEWLFLGYESKGFKQYYTLRLKEIDKDNRLGIEEREYWMNVGRTRELKSLSYNIEKEYNRRKKEEK